MPAALRPREALCVDRASAATAQSGSKCGRGLAADSSIADLLKSTGRTIALPECRDAAMVGNRSEPRTIQE